MMATTALPLLRDNRDRDCKLCKLHELGCRNVCIPTRLVMKSSMKETDTALFVLGEAPGNNEDMRDSPFVGRSGDILTGLYLQAIKAWEYGDVFAGNAVRCRPPQNKTPNKGHVKKCKPWLEQDLKILLSQYKRVVVLCVGSVPAQAMGVPNLSTAWKKQGWTHPSGVSVFFTFHPAYLGRKPEAKSAIMEHLLLLREFLEVGTITHNEDLPPVEQAVLTGDPWASVDIETYGAIVGKQQTAFNPIVSKCRDKVPFTRQIVTGVIANSHTCSGYVWSRPHERWAMIESLISHPTWWGMNLPFDVAYLRAASMRLRMVRPRLVDLSVLTFLEDDIRPERSLKSIAPLLRMGTYDESKIGEYLGEDDPDLMKYNAADAVRTARCIRVMLERLTEQVKEMPDLIRWWSEVLWQCIDMSEVGVHFDRVKLRELHDEEMAKQVVISKDFEQYGYGPIAGKGSRASLAMLFEHSRCKAPGVQLKLTETRREISTCDENRATLLDVLPEGRERAGLMLLDAYQRSSKLTNSMTGTLLGKHLVGAIAYPSWYCVPTHVKDGGGDRGGTRQARPTCKGPGLQTMPPPVKGCMCSRHNPGYLMGVDLSQIELRVAAWLSGDRVMLAEYEARVDRHWERSEELRRHIGLATFGVRDKENPEHELWRQIGKTVNFLILFKGGGYKLVETVWREMRVEIPLGPAQGMIRETYQRYWEFGDWQDALVEEVRRTGFLRLPVTGLRRTFGREMIDENVSEIVNFPVQSTAANVLMAAQVNLSQRMKARGMASRIVLNIYDAMYVDGPAEEERAVAAMVGPAVRESWYVQRLQSITGRGVPLEYEVKVKRRR